MRIAISNTTRNWWGVQQVTDSLVRGLQSRGHEVLVLCRPGSMMAERMRDVARTAPVLGGIDFHPRSLWRAGRALREFGAEVLVATMKKDVRLAAPVARALGVPVVVRHASDQPLRNGAYHRALYGLLPAHHIANSRATRETLLRSSPWLRPERVSVIHNGVDPSRFDGVVPAQLDLGAGRPVFGFVGRFEHRKGVLDLADAWPAVAAALPEARLALVGAGKREPEMRRRLAGAPRVHWLGLRSDIPSVMRALDVVVMPSHWEGFGLVAVEAMTAGRAVVATTASSLPEIVRDGVDGRLVAPGSPDALAAAMIEVGAAPEVRDRMGGAGRERALRNFSITAMLDAYETLLLRVARGSS